MKNMILFIIVLLLLLIINFGYYYLCYILAKKKFNDVTNAQFSDIKKEILNNSSAGYKIKSKQFLLYVVDTAISVGLALMLSELTIEFLEMFNDFLEITLEVLFAIIYWLFASFVGFQMTILLVKKRYKNN